MRYPDTPFMKRTFDLITNWGLGVGLIPYIMETPNSFLFYNNTRVRRQEQGVLNLGPDVGDYLIDETLATNPGVVQKVREVLQPFRQLFVAPLAEAGENPPPPDIAVSMEQLFGQTNNHSMKSHMLLVEGMNPKDVHWCETLDKSTGWYDLALTESK